MLQHHDSNETPLTETSLMSNRADETALETELLAPVAETELAELIASVQDAGVRRQQRVNVKQKVLKKFIYSVGAVGMIISVVWVVGLLYAMTHGILSPNTVLKFLPGLLIPLAAQKFAMKVGLDRLKKGQIDEQEVVTLKRLTELEDVRVVGPLLDITTPVYTTSQRAYWQMMGRLLPRLTAEEIRQLGPKRHTILAGWVCGWEEASCRRIVVDAGDAFLLKLLPVIAEIGQSSFQFKSPVTFSMDLLPPLTKWANGQGAGQDPEVQKAAIDCRETIERKMAQARIGEQLLRASAPTEAGSDSLLRPLEGTQATDPRELLRPDEQGK